ncbi:hypothetical protein HYC85_016544 [Camellia sinensis]|uniref:Uncharacterized protein n=1 Tax=Camellia sinensis TaxID=4442 RepID=A0A7J7H3P0_CAMSI|nr:hypothetical protein HYC85_016544 [Camellia sinensis]
MEAVIPLEVGLPTIRSENFDPDLNGEAIALELDLAEERRERALVHIASYQQELSRKYNKTVHPRQFKIGDWVLRKVMGNTLVLGDGKLGPNWEGPYKVVGLAGKGAYHLEDKDGKAIPRPWNTANLKTATELLHDTPPAALEEQVLRSFTLLDVCNFAFLEALHLGIFSFLLQKIYFGVFNTLKFCKLPQILVFHLTVSGISLISGKVGSGSGASSSRKSVTLAFRRPLSVRTLVAWPNYVLDTVVRRVLSRFQQDAYPFISSIDISDNLLEDQIPRNISLIFPNLRNLNMSTNLFEGYIPTSLGDMHSLTIPEHLVIGCSSRFLKLSNNNLYGLIPLSFVNLTLLSYLYLDNNHFVGKFPNSICFSPLLCIWYQQQPVWRASEKDGEHLCKLGQLEFLDLSDNNLSGFIPSCFNTSNMRHVHLNQNKPKGPLTFVFFNCSSLVTLDINDNSLNGIIPSWIATLSHLSILLLKLNNFKGEIPIHILDLSQNNFYGPIPHCFVDIPFGTTHTKSFVEVDSWYGNILYPFWEFVKGSKSLGEHDMLNDGSDRFRFLDIQQEVEFTTKHGIYAY